MPEIAEVARIVHYLRQHLAGKTLGKVTAQADENVYGKVGCSAETFQKAMTGRKVLDAKQKGKYFWMIMESPPHPLMHFGMAGWLKIKDSHTYYYKMKGNESDEEWPPKYWKFLLETKESAKVEAAFVDFRRFARIRLIDCPADEIQNVPPLSENGPDPIQQKDIVTVEWLGELLGRKSQPVKALLLDQANIAGIGNWVGDEVLYNAKIHPEQYSNTLTDAQISQLHKSIQYVCGLAVDNLADSSKFPEEWLFKHRWGKGKKDSTNTLPNGKKFVYLTVGGRTSCVVPSVQKKTGPVAGDVKTEAGGEVAAKETNSKSPKQGGKRKKSGVDVETAQTNGIPERVEKEEEDQMTAGRDSKQRSSKKRKSEAKTPEKASAGRRRSARISNI